MKTFKLKDDFVNGYIPNTYPSKLNVIFKKGDIVQGELKKGTMWNKEWDGIYAKPTVSTAVIENGETEVFIPLTYLEEFFGDVKSKIQIKQVLIVSAIVAIGYFVIKRITK